jgi:hypothetical protein
MLQVILYAKHQDATYHAYGKVALSGEDFQRKVVNRG